jgi:glucose dehydrogenase
MTRVPALYVSPAAPETEKEVEMLIPKRPGTRGGFVAALALVALLAACGGAPSVQGTPTPMACNTPTAAGAMSVPPGAPVEDICYAAEWPAPNGDLYNTRVAHSTIASTNVSKLEVAWTIPLQGKGADGADVANPVLANGIAYLQDGASNVIAVQNATGRVLWTHDYNSPEISGPNGVTIATGRRRERRALLSLLCSGKGEDSIKAPVSYYSVLPQAR